MTSAEGTTTGAATPTSDLRGRTALLAAARVAAARLDATGVVVAGWLFGQSLGPSLLLRSWLFQGVLAGVAVAVGYLAGRMIARVSRWLWRRTRWAHLPTPPVARRTRLAALTATVLYAAWAALRAVPQHRWTWRRLGHEPGDVVSIYVGSLAAAALVAALLLLAAWLVRQLWRGLTRAGTRVLPRWIAGGLALVVVVWGVTATLSNVVMTRTLDGFNATFAGADQDLEQAPDAPSSALRSGGPGSAVDWALTGREGRRFLTRGPSVEQLADFVDGPVEEPIRVFVGRAQADEVEKRVAVAMDELERTGAFEREALLVVVPTGTGWVNEQLVQPLEYFHAGGIATVAIQYSHLPSPLAFLAEQEAAGATSTQLFEAVERRLSTLDQPPALYVAGESLGSFGGSQAFASLEDSAARTAGAVWVGPPETVHLRREAERDRRPGSLQIRPVVGDGSQFVFVNRSSDFDDLDPRRPPHTVFLQQADDPIVWWDWSTAHEEPDWLREPLDPAVNPALDWAPVTTFLQLAVDMAVSNDFDEEHGHLYGTLPLTSWYAVVQPPGWDEATLEELRTRLAAVRR